MDGSEQAIAKGDVVYLWGEKGRNHRAPEEKDADPMNKAAPNRHT
jgi:hypothetical protein